MLLWYKEGFWEDLAYVIDPLVLDCIYMLKRISGNSWTSSDPVSTKPKC